MSPRRVQMSRQRPWRQEHPDAVIVARPSRWGNPYAVGAWIRDCEAEMGRDAGTGIPLAPISLHRYGTPGYTVPEHYVVRQVADHADAVECFRVLAAEWRREDEDAFSAWLAPLAGRDLACWCPLDEPCHADVLLELANGAQS